MGKNLIYWRIKNKKSEFPLYKQNIFFSKQNKIVKL